jgi:hypothetical protein
MPVIKLCVGQRFTRSLLQHSVEQAIAFTSRRLRSEGKICQYPFNKRNIYLDNFFLCTLHSEIYTVHSPTNALFIKL